MEKSNDIKTEFIRRSRYKGGTTNKEDLSKRLKKEFFKNMNNTDYTLCVRGTGNFSARMYETLALGRIPIFVNTDCILPFNNKIDWDKHVVWVEYNEISENHYRALIFSMQGLALPAHLTIIFSGLIENLCIKDIILADSQGNVIDINDICD